MIDAARYAIAVAPQVSHPESVRFNWTSGSHSSTVRFTPREFRGVTAAAACSCGLIGWTTAFPTRAATSGPSSR